MTLDSIFADLTPFSEYLPDGALRNTWPEVHIHFIEGEGNHPLFQWRFITADNELMLGDFTASGISYQVSRLENIARFARWYRKIVAPEYRLIFYDSGLYFRVIELMLETTEEDILRAFDTPFDLDAFEKLVSPPTD